VHWSAAYIGIPFKDHGRGPDALDCWGIVALSFKGRGIELPDYGDAYASADERSEVAALFGKAGAWPWHPVEIGREQEFDIAIFRRGRLDGHIGVVTGKGEMLHIEAGGTSCLAPIYHPDRLHRLTGIYRHEAMMGAA
jgi:probable lipoprotein NlpC